MKAHKTPLIIAGVVSALALTAAPLAASAYDRDSRHSDRGSVSYGMTNGHHDDRGRYEGGGRYEGRGRFDDRGYWHSFDSRIDDMRRRLEMGRRYGSLSWYEYRRLNDRLNDIAWQKSRFQRTGRGINRDEARVLDGRLDRLSAEIRYQKTDRDFGHDRDYGHGRGRR